MWLILIWLQNLLKIDWIYDEEIINFVFCAFSIPSTESGWDNPFRPGGDLSREADEIVSLIKGELSILH